MRSRTSYHKLKMSRFELKITDHTMNQGDLKLNEERPSIDSNTEMIEILELSDEDFKAAII